MDIISEITTFLLNVQKEYYKNKVVYTEELKNTVSSFGCSDKINAFKSELDNYLKQLDELISNVNNVTYPTQEEMTKKFDQIKILKQNIQDAKNNLNNENINDIENKRNELKASLNVDIGKIKENEQSKKIVSNLENILTDYKREQAGGVYKTQLKKLVSITENLY